jgi:hypothetical protein
MNSIMVQFADGVKVVTSRYAVRANDASQWRRGKGVRFSPEAESRRPLNSPG